MRFLKVFRKDKQKAPNDIKEREKPRLITDSPLDLFKSYRKPWVYLSRYEIKTLVALSRGKDHCMNISEAYSFFAYPRLLPTRVNLCLMILEHHGLVEEAGTRKEGGRVRRIYRLTERGKEIVEDYIREKPFQKALRQMKPDPEE